MTKKEGEKLKITGAAPKIAIPTFIFMIITIIIDKLTSPLFKISASGYPVLVITGVVLIAVGAIIVINTAIMLQKSFKAGLLMTNGMYRIFRNPMYSAYLIFVIPGICLLFNSWLVLTTVIVNFVLLKVFIREEYRYLEEKFGDEYKKYLETVLIRFL